MVFLMALFMITNLFGMENGSDYKRPTRFDFADQSPQVQAYCHFLVGEYFETNDQLRSARRAYVQSALLGNGQASYRLGHIFWKKAEDLYNEIIINLRKMPMGNYGADVVALHDNFSLAYEYMNKAQQLGYEPAKIAMVGLSRLESRIKTITVSDNFPSTHM